MGRLNLIKADFTGKVGQLVGAKWKNISTVRSYSKPAYTNTPAQQDVRNNFAKITTIVAAFAPQIKSLSSLSVRSMSVRNAIIKLNKGMFSGAGFIPSAMKINAGGLPAPTGVVVTPAATHDNITATWTPVTGATISVKARVVFVVVDDAGSFAVVGDALNSAGTMSLAAEYPPSARLNVYYYLIDYRGSAKVGSTSGYQTTTIPTRVKTGS
jgi:hypothetical protein